MSPSVGFVFHDPAEIHDMVHRANDAITILFNEISASLAEAIQSPPKREIKGVWPSDEYNEWYLRWKKFYQDLINESWPYVHNNLDSTYDLAKSYLEENGKWRKRAFDCNLVGKANDLTLPPKEPPPTTGPFTVGVGVGGLGMVAIGAAIAYFLTQRGKRRRINYFLGSELDFYPQHPGLIGFC